MKLGKGIEYELYDDDQTQSYGKNVMNKLKYYSPSYKYYYNKSKNKTKVIHMYGGCLRCGADVIIQRSAYKEIKSIEINTELSCRRCSNKRESSRQKSACMYLYYL